MTRPLPTLLAGLVLAGGALSLALPGPGPQARGTDYEKLPPKPSEVLAALEKAPIDAVAAIQRAEAATGGRATSLGFDAASGRFRVETCSEESAWRVELDAEGEVASKAAVPRLPGDAVRGEPVTTESGLVYYVLREGTGAVPSSPTAQVTVHYTGWLVDGTKFDSSVDRGQPSSFGLNQVIRGWTEGVGSMRVGEKRKLVIPFALAYGAGGRAPTIPPRATLIFDVELISAR